MLAFRCLVLLLAVLLAPLVSSADGDDQKKLDGLKKAISSLQKDLKSRDREKNTLLEELGKVEKDVASLRKSVRSLEGEIRTLDNSLARLNAEQQQLQSRIREHSKAIASQLATAYKLGQQEPLKLLLNQEDPQRLSRVIRYYDYFLRQRTEKIDAYTADVTRLNEVVQKVSADKLALNQSKEKLVERQRQVVAGQQQRKKALAALSASLKTDRQRLDKMTRERKDLEQLLSAVEEAINDIKVPNDYRPFAQRKGKLEWPLKGRIRAGFGNRRSGSLRWEGWLIQANSGTPVKAVHHGRVVFADYLRGFGLLSIIDHGDDYMTLYAHNRELLKEVGDWVLPEEVIAYAGNSGGREESALYFEIRRKGKPHDPKVWLARR